MTAWALLGPSVAIAASVTVAWLCGVANREDSRPGLFGILQWLVLAALGFAGARLVLGGDPLGVLALCCVGVLGWPWAIARRWLIPRGHWRLAWWLVRSSAWTWHDDNRGGALVAAAWAAVRAGGPKAALGFVEARCERSDCGAAHLLATGLVAAARGDLEGARRWIGSLCEFEGDAAPRMARRLAVQWCAAEAATRGAWGRVAELAEDRDADAVTVMLGAVARRLLGRAPVPDDAELERLWRRAPDCDAWSALVDRARDHAPVDASADAPVVTSVPADPDPHRAALRAHARLLGATRPALADVAATARAWDRVLADPVFAAGVRGRAAALGARGDAIEGLRATIDGDLVALVCNGDIAIGEDPSLAHDTLGRVRRAVHQRLLDELEVIADAMQSRVRARKALAIHEEWREYLALRGAFARAVAVTGPGLQRLGYAIVNPAICGLAVWLWNDRKNRVHAHQMFLWLLREARVAEDREAIALHERNVSCGR